MSIGCALGALGLLATDFRLPWVAMALSAVALPVIVAVPFVAGYRAWNDAAPDEPKRPR